MGGGRKETAKSAVRPKRSIELNSGVRKIKNKNADDKKKLEKSISNDQEDSTLVAQHTLQNLSSKAPTSFSSPDEVDLTFETSKGVKVYTNFETMGLKDDLLRGIYAYNFERPSTIQQRAIVPLIKGKDLIAQAQSGTGKTGAFSIATLQNIIMSKKDVQAIILSPTRELALQSQSVVNALGDYMNVRCVACIGGVSIQENIKALKGNYHVVSGTPGRVLDMIKRQNLKPNSVKMLIIDEADELFTRGFKTQVYDIYRYLPSSTQVAIISATMFEDIEELASKFLVDPIRIAVKKEHLSLEGIQQFYVNVEAEEWKFDTLCDIFDSISITQCVIFCSTRKKVDWLTQKVKEANFTVCSIHGDMPQRDRDAVMSEFRQGKSRLLITTDIWARGIDIQQVSLVINYDLPTSNETYLHRIGRSGRFGRKGTAINFVTNENAKDLRSLEKFYSIRIKTLPSNLKTIV